MFRVIDRRRVVVDFELPSLTKQAPAQETDINFIVNRYLKTGHLPPANGEPAFGYVPSLDLQEAFELVANAEEHFASLPAATRQVFQNDPMALLRAVEDPSQRDMLVQAGLIESEPIVEPAMSESVRRRAEEQFPGLVADSKPGADSGTGSAGTGDGA